LLAAEAEVNAEPLTPHSPEPPGILGN
ncbi:MAG: hypothetical protein JWM85_3105, partial [Acidimicrobiaceae bacterium]|nr:hypothetical protein [Acidimicrobiaceae bacterium]